MNSNILHCDARCNSQHLPLARCCTSKFDRDDWHRGLQENEFVRAVVEERSAKMGECGEHSEHWDDKAGGGLSDHFSFSTSVLSDYMADSQKRHAHLAH